MKLGILGAGGIVSTMAKTVAGMKDGLPDREMNQTPNHSFIHSVHKY